MPLVLRLALAVAASSGLYTVALGFSPLATPLLLLVPFPGLVLATRGPSLEAGLWFCLTAGTVALGLGADVAPGFVFALGVPALVVATGIRWGWSFERTVLAGVAAWTLGVTCLSLLAYGDVTTLVAAVREQLESSVTLALSTSASIGSSTSTVAALDVERELVDGVLQIMPALVVLTGALTVIGNLILLRSATGLSHDVNLRLWRMPETLIWALILTGFAMFVPVPWLALTMRNAFVLVLGGYFCQGLAIVDYYLDRFRLPRGIRVVGYVLVAVQHVVTVTVLALGIFDLWGNFRRLGTGPADVRLDTDGE